MKIDRIICAIGALICFVAEPASAQVDKSVEVTQAFIPQVESATKPMLVPDMTDDAYITPDIDYSITPISIHSQIDSTPYSPVEMSFWEYRHQNSYYAKLGGGFPLRSVADIYLSKSRPECGYMMAFVNQDGVYSDIENDYGVECDAVSYHLGAGAAAGTYIGPHILEGQVRYDLDRWSRYATSNSTDEHPQYQSIGFEGRFGDDYSDMSRWNFSLGVDVDYMWSASDYSSTRYGTNIGFGRGQFRFGVDYQGVDGSEDYSSSTLGFGVGYWLNRESVNLSVGLKYYYDNVVGASSYIIPTFKLDYDLFSTKMVAYVDMGGELLHNDFASLVQRNPYLMAGVSSPKSSVDYDLYVGVKGALAKERLIYDIHAGYGMVLNNIYWAYVESVFTDMSSYNGYMIDYADLHNFNVGVDLSYRVTSKLSFDLGYELNGYSDDDDMSWENGLAKSVLHVGGMYRPGRFSIGVSGDMLSKRSVTAMNLNVADYTSTIEVPTTFDLGVNMEYKSRCGAVIFCDLNNLLNQDLYNYARYREYGVGVVAGVKFIF